MPNNASNQKLFNYNDLEGLIELTSLVSEPSRSAKRWRSEGDRRGGVVGSREEAPLYSSCGRGEDGGGWLRGWASPAALRGL